MKKLLFRWVAVPATIFTLFVGLSSFTEEDESGSTAGGYRLHATDVQCPRDQWAVVTASFNSTEGTTGSVYVKKGNVIPGTNIVAGVDGWYNATNSWGYTNLRETYKTTCSNGEWYEYCKTISCRVMFED